MGETARVRLRGSFGRRPAVFLAGLLAGGLIAVCGIGAAEAQSNPSAPASPSAPPFWARPKPTPSNPCEQEPLIAIAPESGGSSVLTGALSGAAVVLLFLLARRFTRKPAPEPVEMPRVRAPIAPPMPADPSLPAGFDPRARLVTRTAATGAATTAVAAAPATDFKFEDPATTKVEVAEDEPGGTSDRATEFYSEVAYSLLDALHREPARQDLRFKLLEIYFARKQVTEFVNLAHEYLDTNKGYRDRTWREIASMGLRLAPEHELWAGDAPRSAVTRRVHQMRRFHERDIDQGRMYAAQQALTNDFASLRTDPSFRTSLDQMLADAARRPSPLIASLELSHVADVARIFVKHEDRRRSGDDQMINVFGQMLVAQRLGRKRVVTATRDGSLGHVVATAAARLGLECLVYITERDLNQHYARVLSMRRLGAILRPIPGSIDQEQPDPRRAALEAWLNDPATTQYVSGLTGGPPPYPEMIREFISVIGREVASQMHEAAGALPQAVVVAASDGHYGLGVLQGLFDHPEVKLYCIEQGAPASSPVVVPPVAEPEHRPLELPPSKQLLRREHRWLRDDRRVEYIEADEQETLRIVEQFHATGTTLYTDSARALAQARTLARELDPKDSVVVLLTSQDGADFRAAGHDW